MGRSRKPMDTQKGNITVIDGGKKREEEKSVTVGKEQLRTAPKWLIDETATKEWRRLIKELNKIDIIGNLDKNNLAGYCNAFSQYVKVTEELQTGELCIKRETRTGTITIQNPMIGIQKLYAEEMRKFASLCGLTIDSRLKVAVIKTEKKENEIEKRYGNI